MQNLDYNSPEEVGLIFEKFSSFEDICIYSVVLRISAARIEK
jgi:hypothetical protein